MYHPLTTASLVEVGAQNIQGLPFLVSQPIVTPLVMPLTTMMAAMGTRMVTCNKSLRS